MEKGVRGVKGIKVLSQFVLGTNFRTHEGVGLGVGANGMAFNGRGWHLMAFAV